MTRTNSTELSSLRIDLGSAELMRLETVQRFGPCSSQFISAARDMAKIERRIAELQAE